MMSLLRLHTWGGGGSRHANPDEWIWARRKGTGRRRPLED